MTRPGLADCAVVGAITHNDPGALDHHLAAARIRPDGTVTLSVPGGGPVALKDVGVSIGYEIRHTTLMPNGHLLIGAIGAGSVIYFPDPQPVARAFPSWLHVAALVAVFLLAAFIVCVWVA